MELFKGSPVLKEVEKEIIRQAGIYMFLPGGSLLFKAGDPADSVYLVEEGCLQLYRWNNGKEKVMVDDLCTSGELLGMAETLYGEPRGFYATAVSDVEVSVLYRDVILDLLDAEPAIAVKIFKWLAGGINPAQGAENNYISKPRCV